MASRTASVVFLGSDTQLNATLARIEGKLKALTAVAEESTAKMAGSADVAGARFGTAFTAGTDKAGSALTRLGRTGESWGIPLSGSLVKMGAQFDQATSKTEKFGSALASMGKLTLGVGLAGFGVAAAVGVKGAMDLETQMLRLKTQAGASTAEVTKMTHAVLAMAGSVGTGPQTLAESLYHVESAGLRGAKALAVLRIAAEGAQVGGANLVDVQNALDAAVVSGISGAQNYKQAMGQLNAIVGAGDMTMQDLANAMSTGVLASAKVYGLSMKDVGSALATFGDSNIRGAEAATKLQSAIRLMAAPSAAAGKALKAIGVSQLQLAGDMRTGGLIKALEDLKTHFQDSGATATQEGLVLARAFGGRQSTGILLLIDQLSRLEQKQKDITAGGDKFGGAWKDRTHQLSYEFDQLKATLQAVTDKLGLILIPVLQKMGSVLADGVQWLTKHKAAAEALAIAIGSVLSLAVVVFAEQKAVAFSRSVGRMLDDTKTFANWLTGNSGNVEKSLTGIGDAGTTAGTNVGKGMQAAQTEVVSAKTGLAAGAAADSAAITDEFGTPLATKMGTETTAAMSASKGAIVKAEPELAAESGTVGASMGKGMLSGFARIFTGAAIAYIAFEALKGPIENIISDLMGKGPGAAPNPYSPNAHSLGKAGWYTPTSKSVGGIAGGVNQGMYSGAPATPKALSAIAGISSFQPSAAQAQSAIATVAAKYGLSPQTLMGVYGTETGYGSNQNTSSAGAVGPFQFLPSTGATYGLNASNIKQFGPELIAAAEYLKGLGANNNPQSAQTIAALNRYNGISQNSALTGYSNTVLAKGGTTAAAPTSTALQQYLAGLSGAPATTTGTTSGSTAASSTTLGTAIQTGYGAEVVKIQRQIAADSKQAASATETLVVAAHNRSLSSLNTLLDSAHRNALDQLVAKLDATHDTHLEKQGQQLLAAEKTAEATRTQLLVAEQVKSDKALQAIANTAYAKYLNQASNGFLTGAQGQAQAISDSTKVYLDQQAEKGLTGANLVAAQAQTAYDTVVQSSDAAITTAQAQVTAAAGQGKVAQARAQALLDDARGFAVINEAQAQSTLDIATAAANTANTAASAVVPVVAAASTAVTAAAGTVSNVQIHIEGVNPTDAAAIASEVGWVMRTQVPAPA